MQNPETEKTAEDPNGEAGEQAVENQANLTEPTESGEEFGIDPPIIIQGGGH